MAKARAFRESPRSPPPKRHRERPRAGSPKARESSPRMRWLSGVIGYRNRFSWAHGDRVTLAAIWSLVSLPSAFRFQRSSWRLLMPQLSAICPVAQPVLERRTVDGRSRTKAPASPWTQRAPNGPEPGRGAQRRPT
jgi:hypothetical protein